MHRRAGNTRKVVGDLLLSGLNGQLRPGDTIGVWTFNEKLNAGNFPLERWMPQARQRIAAGVVEFLQRQRYEKPTQIDKALAPMMRVVKDSDKITVLLISDGDDKVSGTPFDNEINAAFKLNSSAQRKLNMPFVTVLRGRKGEFVGGRVSMSPWPVEFPEFPAEPPVAQEKPKPEAPKAERPPTVPSLIVIGKKPEPTAAAPTNGTPTAALRATTQQVTVVPSAPVKPETAPPPKAETTSSPKVQAAPETSPEPAAAIASTNVATTVPSIAPAPAQSARATSSPVSAATSEPASSDPAQTPAVQTAVATPSETVFKFTGILIAGVALLVVMLGLVYAFMRRSRTPAQVSLITRSMDRDKK